MSQNSLQNLAVMTLRQLRQIASDVGVSLYSRKSKEELVEAISTYQLETGRNLEAIEAEMSPAPRPEAETRVVFLPRDPQWAYVFWEISSSDQERAKAAGATQLALRVADVTGLPLGAAHPHTLQELVVSSGATEWHLPMPVSDRDYRVQLGYRTKSGGWFSLATSSVARMPALEPAAVVADAFVPFSLDAPVMAAAQPVVSGGVEHERIYQLATAGSLRSRRVGSEVLHEWDQDSARSGALNDSGAGLWASGRSESGSGILQPNLSLVSAGRAETACQVSHS